MVLVLLCMLFAFSFLANAPIRPDFSSRKIIRFCARGEINKYLKNRMFSRDRFEGFDSREEEGMILESRLQL